MSCKGWFHSESIVEYLRVCGQEVVPELRDEKFVILEVGGSKYNKRTDAHQHTS